MCDKQPNFVLFTCFTVMVTTLAVIGSGCERPPDAAAAGQRAKLVVAVAASAHDRAGYQAAVREFMANHPNVDVELMEVPGDYYDKVLVMIAGRNSPDLMWMGQSFQEFATRGVFLDLTDRIAAEISPANFVPEAMEWYQFQGKQYGIAFGLDVKFIVFNKDLFDAAGVEYPTDDWTYGQFLDRARRLTKDANKDGSSEQFGFQGDLDCSLFDAAAISGDGQRALCNSPQMIDYLQTNLDLAESHRISPHGKQMVNEAFDNLVSTFRKGNVAMMTMATWNLPEMQERCSDMRWDIAPNPIVRKNGHWASSQAIVISADTRYPEEAWQLCKSFLATQFQKSKYPTVLPTNIQVQHQLQQDYGQTPPSIQTMMTASRSLNRLPRIARLSELQQYWYDACDSVWTLRATPAEAMSRAEKEINDAIEAYGNGP